MSLNIFTMTGRIGRNAEYRAFPKGGGVLSFAVATNSGFGDKEKTLWIRANIFGKRAEGNLIDFLLKGQEIALSGELSQNEYTDKNQQQKTSLELNVVRVELIGGKPQQAPAATPNAAAAPTPSAAPQNAAAAPAAPLDDDIPF